MWHCVPCGPRFSKSAVLKLFYLGLDPSASSNIVEDPKEPFLMDVISIHSYPLRNEHGYI